MTTTTTGTTPDTATAAGEARSFRRMDESTAEQWQTIVTATMAHQPHVADQILDMLRSLSSLTMGFAVDQLVHSLQTAARAEADGADPEMVVAALCHDVGKVASVANHPAVAAEILRPYVRDDVYHVVRTHQDFQGQHYYGYVGLDPSARDQYRGEPWFDQAEQFADAWDQTSFDPAYPTPPLEHFEPALRSVFARIHAI